MYPVQRKYRDSRYLRSVYEATHSVEERIPTFSRTLDTYFDVNFEALIEEWQLVTDYELQDLEKKLDAITGAIDALYSAKSELEERASSLKKEIEELEEVVS